MPAPVPGTGPNDSRNDNNNHGHHNDYGNHHYGCGHYGYGSYFGSYNSWGLGFGNSYSNCYDLLYYDPFYCSSYSYGFWGVPFFHASGRGVYPRSGRMVRYAVYDDPQGAIDVNVKPKDTEVFLNGRYLGTSGDFDGWPRYLWLSDEVHELIFYKPGYETVVREVEIVRGEVIDLKMRLQVGLETPPEQLTRFRERGPIEEVASTVPSYAAPGHTLPPPVVPDQVDLRAQAGRVLLAVTPAEASIYIDGRFLGVGAELSAIEKGLLMDPGEHTIQVFHPGHASHDQTFMVESGKQIDLQIELAKQ